MVIIKFVERKISNNIQLNLFSIKLIVGKEKIVALKKKNLCTVHKKVSNKSCRKCYYLQKWSMLFLSYDARFTIYMIKHVFKDALPPAFLKHDSGDIPSRTLGNL